MLETELIERDCWVPLPTVADHGVEDDEQLPHASDVGDLGRLPSVAKSTIEDPDDRVPFRGAQAAHEEGRSHRGAAAPDHALASEETAVPSEWGDSDERSDLLVGESTELGEFSDEGTREVRTDAGYVAQEVALGSPDGAFADQLVEFGVDVGELALEPTDVLIDALLDSWKGEAESIVLGRDHVDDLAPAPDDRVQSTGFLIW